MSTKQITGKLALLLWVQKIAKEYDIKVENFASHFKDSRVICAIINYYFPDELDYQSIKTDKQQEILNNFKEAFDIAEKHGVMKLLDPEDMLTPDTNSIMLYMAGMNKAFKPLPKGISSTKKEEALKEIIQDTQFQNIKQNVLKNLNITVNNTNTNESSEEKEKLEKERLEKERLEKERLEKERVEKERLEKETQEKETKEKERLEKERLEQERVEKERLEKERIEKERIEKETQEKETQEKERLEKERLEQEREEKERLEKERIEKERQEKEKLEKERLEKERLERERLEIEKMNNEERQNLIKLENEEKERQEKENQERERKEKERQERERQEKERQESVEKTNREKNSKPPSEVKFHPTMVLSLLYLILGYFISGYLIDYTVFNFYFYIVLGIFFGISKWKPEINIFPILFSYLPYLLLLLSNLDLQLVDLSLFIKSLLISKNLFKVHHNLSFIVSFLSSKVVLPLQDLLGIQNGGWSISIFFIPRIIFFLSAIFF